MSNILEETYHSVIIASSLQDTNVVIKRSRNPDDDPRTIDRWQKELDALKVAGIHENIAKVLDFDRTELTITLRRELGCSLDKCIDSHTMSTLSVSDCDILLTQMSSALAHLHLHGIVHDDVKPENIMWSSEHKHSVLIDFGAAFNLSVVGKDYFIFSGTPSYVPPEYLKKRKEPEGDVWALGITMLFALGYVKLPKHEFLLPGVFEGPDGFQGGRHFEGGKHLREMEVWLAEVEQMTRTLPAKESLIVRMLDPDPDSRIKSMELAQQRI